ncbi:MAG: GNAT family N-acetyltransferase [Deltaproteobacteria bacterium]|nr:GNAT family N-acetyltransferase [Deltaproteobacteria bacterium]
MSSSPPPALVTIPRVRSARLLLREPRLADFEAAAHNDVDPAARQFMGGAVDRRESFRRFLLGAGGWVVQGMGWWTIEAEGGEPVGTVGVFRRESRPDLEMGWMIHQAHWGKGYAPEAGRAALEHAFRNYGVDRVIAFIAKGNAPSIRVAEKLGMRCLGEADFYGEVDWLYEARASG